MIVPDLPVELPGLSEYPISSATVVEGRRFRPPGLRLRSGSSAGARGRRRRRVGQTWATSGPPRALTSASPSSRYPDGSRTLLSKDGFFVVVDPSLWRKGSEAVAAVDAALPAELVVRMEPSLSERTDTVEEAAAEKLSRGGSCRTNWSSCPTGSRRESRW